MDFQAAAQRKFSALSLGASPLYGAAYKRRVFPKSEFLIKMCRVYVDREEERSQG